MGSKWGQVYFRRLQRIWPLFSFPLQADHGRRLNRLSW